MMPYLLNFLLVFMATLDAVIVQFRFLNNMHVSPFFNLARTKKTKDPMLSRAISNVRNASTIAKIVGREIIDRWVLI